MTSFVTIDEQGNFILDGKPWFLHGAVYFGRRPGTCGADWMGENFQHNLSFLDQDIETMHQLGLNTWGVFVPNYKFIQGLQPVEERFDQLEHFLERIKAAGLRAIILDLWNISKETWCAENAIDPGEGLWNPAIHPEAMRAAITSKRIMRERFADHSEIIGWATDIGRFFDYKFTIPAVRDSWAAWLRHRFDWDFAQVRELFNLASDEYTWERVRMPTEMEPYFNHQNPRSFEYAVMHQELITNGLNRFFKAVRPFTPNHLIITTMEGCDFSSGHLTNHIPEKLEADALWIEYYHWEGLRSYHMTSEESRRWMPEPVADKPSVEILNAAGYVQMLTQWMKKSKKPLIISHGVDIGDKRRGVRSEGDQYLMLGRYNTWYFESGGAGVSYWCWSDDELSKTFTRQFGVEFGSDTDESKKAYPQAGETMGVVRYDGTPRPVGEKLRQAAADRAGKPVKKTPGDVLVLLPAPLFQSVYRYRANLSAFGVFTSLARQGILANLAFTSAGETLISYDEIAPYRLVILGVSSYQRDYPQVPEMLLQYVQQGGTLFLPLGKCDRLVDPYLKVRPSLALKALAGCQECQSSEQNRLEKIQGVHPRFSENLAESWELAMDEPAFFARVKPELEAEILATTGGLPLLYRHPLGQGRVYVYTWNLDVLIYQGHTLDHYSDQWDWLWKGIAAELGLKRDLNSPLRRTILEMMAEYSA